MLSEHMCGSFHTRRRCLGFSYGLRSILLNSFLSSVSNHTPAVGGIKFHSVLSKYSALNPR